MNKCLNKFAFTLLLITSFIEFASILLFIFIVSLCITAKHKSPSISKQFTLILFISIGELALCAIALIITLIFGAFGFYLINIQRIKCYSISSLIFIVILGALVVSTLISPIKPEVDVPKEFNIVFELFFITVFINMSKTFLYILTIILSLVEIRMTQKYRSTPTIDKEEINEEITPELYTSFLEACKHPDDFQLQKEFTKQRLLRKNKSFNNDNGRISQSLDEKRIVFHLSVS